MERGAGLPILAGGHKGNHAYVPREWTPIAVHPS